MTLTQMRYFKAVCQHMSLTKASRELHISQPALSMAIKEIESTCGVPLFKRTANSLSITDEGIVLLEEITTILNQHDHLQGLLSNRLLNRNYVRIGLSVFSGNTVFPEIVGRFREKYPDIKLFVTETGTIQHYENLDSGKIDIAITSRHPKLTLEEWDNSDVYAHLALKQTDQVFAVSRHNPLAQKTEVTWEEIVKEPLIMMEDSYGQTKHIKSCITKAGLEIPSNIHYTSQQYTIERFIEKNAAAGFLPADTVAENPQMVGLHFSSERGRYVYLIYRKDRHLFLSEKLFIQTAKEVFPNYFTHSKKKKDAAANGEL